MGDGGGVAMSARMLAVLSCDHAGCDRRYAWSDDHETWKPPRLSRARAYAHAEGWRHGVRLRIDSGPAPSLDFCPEHAGDVAGCHEVTGARILALAREHKVITAEDLPAVLSSIKRGGDD